MKMTKNGACNVKSWSSLTHDVDKEQEPVGKKKTHRVGNAHLTGKTPWSKVQLEAVKIIVSNFIDDKKASKKDHPTADNELKALANELVLTNDANKRQAISRGIKKALSTAPAFHLANRSLQLRNSDEHFNPVVGDFIAKTRPEMSAETHSSMAFIHWFGLKIVHAKCFNPTHLARKTKSLQLRKHAARKQA
jgi:hypothetical protein